MRNKPALMKVDPIFKKMLEEVRIRRIALGKDRKLQSFQRMTKGIARHDNLRKDLEIAEFIKDETGQFGTFSIFTFMIVGFLAIILFAGLIYVSGILNTTFHDIGVSNDQNSNGLGVNMTQASDDIFGQMNNSIQALRMVAMTLIFSLILATIIFGAFVRYHPVLFIVYIFMVVLAVIFAATMSNAYETLLNSNIYDGLLLSFGSANWIMLNLPLVTALTGILGSIFMFIGIIRSGNEVSL